MPDSCSYNVMIQGFLQIRDSSTAVRLIDEMVGKGFSADSTTFQMLLDLESPDEIISRFMRGSSRVEKKLEPDIILCTILIEGMFIAGKLEVAKELFSKLFADGIRPTIRTYNVMIKGLLKEGLSDEAYDLFRKMEDDGFLPDSCSYNVIIQGFLQNQDSSTAIRLIDEMVGKRFSADLSTFQMLLDLESHDEIISQFMRGSSQGFLGADLNVLLPRLAVFLLRELVSRVSSIPRIYIFRTRAELVKDNPVAIIMLIYSLTVF
ncbi:hypothetical protein POTOM_020616 [Populus tomentosa]|uniref:Uncharacterized protein n=1 Tax=Populus tomentosa TaxID=118781 RepID=A0A8X8D0L0_POPTO|nr:hypothetical protein POTOM_020616 [Populus tomentosa]